jgi:uncharacterized membrane-anchored protein YhcB (DUF1043 family)
MDIRDKELEALRTQLQEMQQKLAALVGEDTEIVKDQVKQYWDRAASSLKEHVDQSVAQLNAKLYSRKSLACSCGWATCWGNCGWYFHA